MLGQQYDEGNTFQSLMINSSEFVHVPIRWNFLFLLREMAPEGGIQKLQSFELAGPLGVFQSRNALFYNYEAMKSYINFFEADQAGAGEPDYDQILRSSSHKLRENQINCDYDKFIWNVYNRLLFQLGADDNNQAQLYKRFEEVVAILNMPCFRLLDVAKEIKVLNKVLNAFFQYNYPQFSASAQTHGSSIVRKLETVLSSAASAEALLVKDHILK